MKQRITEAQYNKLTDEQKSRLFEWYRVVEDSSFIPLLSIGEMIEFINEKRPIKSIAKNRFDKWFVNIDTAMLGYKDELCDTLWEATTRVLKESVKQ